MIKPAAICVMIAPCFLAGCFRTTVHLHADDLPETTQTNTLKGLRDKGFTVTQQDNAQFSDDNLVLYFPHEGIEKDLYAIEEVLAANSLSAEHRYTVHQEKLGKREYTADNIGLYLSRSNLENDE